MRPCGHRRGTTCIGAHGGAATNSPWVIGLGRVGNAQRLGEAVPALRRVRPCHPSASSIVGKGPTIDSGAVFAGPRRTTAAMALFLTRSAEEATPLGEAGGRTM